MDKSEIRRLVEEHEQYCLELGQAKTLEELEAFARVVFPAGTLPDETEPISFSRRELEILRALQWRTEETKQRITQAYVMSTWAKAGV